MRHEYTLYYSPSQHTWYLNTRRMYAAGESGRTHALWGHSIRRFLAVARASSIVWQRAGIGWAAEA